MQKAGFLITRLILLLLGNEAAKYLLKEAKFLSNAGLSRVYTKTGGYSKALADFKEVNTAKDVVKRPVPGAFYVRNTRGVQEIRGKVL